MDRQQRGDNRLIASFLVFKVVAGLWIFQNVLTWDVAILPLVSWLIALVLAYLGWLHQRSQWVRWAYRFEWLALLSLWSQIIWGLASQWRWATRQLTAYEVDLLLRSGTFYLVAVLGAYRLKQLAREWPLAEALGPLAPAQASQASGTVPPTEGWRAPAGTLSTGASVVGKQIATVATRKASAASSARRARRQQILSYLQLGMLLFFLVPLLNQVRFGFQMIDLRQVLWLDGLLLATTGLAFWARYRQSARSYWLLLGLNVLLVATPVIYWLLLEARLTPFFWRSLVLYLPFAYAAQASGRLARALVRERSEASEEGNHE